MLRRTLGRGSIEILRDKGTLFFTVFFPVLLVFILGTLLSSMDDAEPDIGTIEVLYVIEQSDAPQAAIITTAFEMFANEISADGQITFKKAEAGIDDAKKQASKGDATSALHLDADGNIKLYSGADAVKSRAVKLIIESFSERYAAEVAVYMAEISDNPHSSTENRDIEQSSIEDVTNAQETASKLLRDSDLGTTRSMIDYYAVAMIVMIIFMGSTIGGAEDIYEGRRQHQLMRILASPGSRARLYIEIILAKIPQNIIQVICVMLVSTLLFGAHYASDFAGNVLLFAMLFMSGMVLSAICSIIGIFINFSPTALIMPIAWVMLFFSGTFSKEIFIPGISEYLPSSILQQAAFDLTVFGRPEQCILVLAVSIPLFIVASGIGALFFSRKGFAV